VGGYVLAGVQIGFVLYISVFLWVLGWCPGVCVLVYASTHTQTSWVLDVSPGRVWDGHLESQKNPDRLKRIIHVDRISVHSTFVDIYAVLWVLMIWANCSFLLTCLFF